MDHSTASHAGNTASKLSTLPHDGAGRCKNSQRRLSDYWRRDLLTGSHFGSRHIGRPHFRRPHKESPYVVKLHVGRPHVARHRRAAVVPAAGIAIGLNAYRRLDNTGHSHGLMVRCADHWRMVPWPIAIPTILRKRARHMPSASRGAPRHAAQQADGYREAQTISANSHRQTYRRRRPGHKDALLSIELLRDAP